MNPCDPPLPCTGILLAGGRSSRMGRDKALLQVGGVSLWERQLDLLREACDGQAWISAREIPAWLPADVPCIPDRADAGPIGGMLAALEAAAPRAILCLGLDMPGMRPDCLRHARRLARPDRGSHPVHSLPGDPAGAPGARPASEPLASVLVPAALPLLRDALAGGRHSLRGLIDALESAGLSQGWEIPADWLPCFANLNTPADYDGWLT